MTGGIAKVVIFSFTERGTKQNRYIYRKLKMQGYICEGYAPAKYVMGEEGGVKQLPKKKEDLLSDPRALPLLPHDRTTKGSHTARLHPPRRQPNP